MDGLDAMSTRREELRGLLERAEGRILELETRSVDVDIMRRGLAAFVEVFESLDLLQKKEFVRLLVCEVVYDKPQSRVRLELIPFQDFDWPIDQFSPGLPSVQSGCPRPPRIKGCEN